MVGKNIEKDYKIVIFLKKEIEKRRFFRWLNNNMRCFEIRIYRIISLVHPG